MSFTNPFSRDPEAQRNVTAYRVFTLASFILAFSTAIAYTSTAPNDDRFATGTIFGISNANPTPFTLSIIFVAIYWITLFILQMGYIFLLFTGDVLYVRAAVAVGGHFILFNFLTFAWVMLWCRSLFIWSELVQVVQFLQLTALYFRHPLLPRWIHSPVVALPLTFTFFLVLWNGAVMVNCVGMACRVLANVTIWGILVFAGFFLSVFRDWHVGFATAFLSAGLGVGQFLMRTVALQWPFAFAIMALVFVGTAIAAAPGAFGAADVDRERAPLLRE